jgi:hypothetical protein
VCEAANHSFTLELSCGGKVRANHSLLLELTYGNICDTSEEQKWPIPATLVLFDLCLCLKVGHIWLRFLSPQNSFWCALKVLASAATQTDNAKTTSVSDGVVVRANLRTRI